MYSCGAAFLQAFAKIKRSGTKRNQIKSILGAVESTKIIIIMEFHPRSTQSELFELLDRLQSARLDDQRCELPTSGKQTGGKIRESDSRQNSSKQMLQRILKHPPPYPMVALTNQCAYWTEPNSEHSNSVTQPPLVTCGPTHEEDSAKMYRLHFCGYEHYNFCANITSDTNNLSDQASLSSSSSHTVL